MQKVKTRKISQDNWVAKALLGCDRHSDGFQFKIDGDGSSSLPTYAGALLSLMALCIMTFYTAYKIDILLKMGSSSIVQYTIQDSYDSESQFSAENGLEFAVAVIG